MAPLQPEALSLSDLPRGPLGHLKEDAVAGLLQRAARDYREALSQRQRLTRTIEELNRRVDELTAHVASLEEVAARQRNPDELARALVAAAQRAAREERESARRQAELMLKKAARRAERVKEESARYETDRVWELDRLDAVREDVAAGLREVLETIAGLYSDRSNGGRVDERAPDDAVIAEAREAAASTTVEAGAQASASLEQVAAIGQEREQEVDSERERREREPSAARAALAREQEPARAGAVGVGDDAGDLVGNLQPPSAESADGQASPPQQVQPRSMVRRHGWALLTVGLVIVAALVFVAVRPRHDGHPAARAASTGPATHTTAPKAGQTTASVTVPVPKRSHSASPSASALPVSAGSVQAVAVARRREGEREAQKLLLLFGLRLPPDTRPVPTRSGPRTLRAVTPGVSTETMFADRYGLWRVQEPLASAIAVVKRLATPGFKVLELSGNAANPPVTLQLYDPLAGGLPIQRLVTVTFVPLHRATLIRVDAEAAWIYPRSSFEVVPQGVSEIDIRTPQRTVRVIDSAKVARILRWFDALNVVQPVHGVGCLDDIGLAVPFTFRSASGGTLASATVPALPANGCDPINFTVRGQRQTPLIDSTPGEGMAFIDRVQRLLSVHLGPHLAAP